MGRYYSTQTTSPFATGAPVSLGDAASLGGKIHAEVATRVTTGELVGDDIVLGKTKKGAIYLGSIVNVSATLGAAATLALGIEGSTSKYAAGAVYATADTPVFKGKATAIGVEETDEKLILGTVAVAALAVGVTLQVINLFAWPHGG